MTPDSNVAAAPDNDPLIDVHRRFGTFKCPACGGGHFSTETPLDPLGQWVRECDDQFGVGCFWRGPDAECGLHDDLDAVPAEAIDADLRRMKDDPDYQAEDRAINGDEPAPAEATHG